MLIAANADIGAAKALYYPDISLTGTLGSVSTAFGNFLTGPATTWAVLAGLAGPIFNAGAIAGSGAHRRGRPARGARRRTSGRSWSRSRKPTTRWSACVKKREETIAQDARVVSLREYARLSRLKFNNGYASYLEVLYAENELFGAELAAVRSHADTYIQQVDVYKAMGGGWIDVADALTPAAAATPLDKRVADQPMF